MTISVYPVNVFMQPSADIGAFLSDLEQYISSSNFPHHVILGDINIDTLKSDPVNTSYLNILSCSHFMNSIQIPTRYNFCLDHINVNFYDKFLTSGTITTSIADHLLTFIKIENLTNYFNITKSTNIRNYKKINEELFLKDLSKVDWNSEVYAKNDVNSRYDSFFKIFMDLCNKHAPLVKFSTNCPRKLKTNKRPWISVELIKLMNKRDYVYRQSLNSPLNLKLKFKHKTLNNLVTKNLRRSKTSYFESFFENTSDSSKCWKVINEHLGKNRSKGLNAPKSLTSENITLTEDKDIANSFNKYFTSMGTTLSKKFTDDNFDFTARKSDKKLDEQFSFTNIESTVIESLLKDM
ncbi:hypothetical protein EB796_022050 [Bugula neritina]|uniref:Endonuclease/exonuclease/phosphatase domain-containing protein n=1 Tax=Bugula neritina TaxID=10212 RepID=A0A7J7J1S4_BUGNE|nr:hypothetical protein EB796_022050 [Bugula neritina]